MKTNTLFFPAPLRAATMPCRRSLGKTRPAAGLRYASILHGWESNSALLNRAMLRGFVVSFMGEANSATLCWDVADYVLGHNPLGHPDV
ncbi:MAG: hypothetical protein EON55_21345 [Alphaproteobacteria bacterium]|nr:MAG: hypothetical protein EON55_21345 [Alphaproteobacteria bacterium]